MEGNWHLDTQPLNTKDPKGTQGFVQKYIYCKIDFQKCIIVFYKSWMGLKDSNMSETLA